jgi:hypothetical protein
MAVNFESSAPRNVRHEILDHGFDFDGAETGLDSDEEMEVGHENPLPVVPALTFGLEQEINFAMLKSRSNAFDATQPSPDLGGRPTSYNTGSEKLTFLLSHRAYVMALLNHEIPEDEKTFGKPMEFEKVVAADPKVHSYDKFTLVLDDSVMPKWDAQFRFKYVLPLYIKFEGRLTSLIRLQI